MGCYTQFDCKVMLRKDTPEDVILFIMHRIYDPLALSDSNYMDIPNDTFFKNKRWDGVFMGPSFHHPKGASLIKTNHGYYRLQIHCDINYGVDEVQDFVKWIAPYVAGRRKKKYVGRWTHNDIDWHCNEYVNTQERIYYE